MTDINVNKLSEALNTKADIDLNNTGVFSTVGGGVNLTSPTPPTNEPSKITSKEIQISESQGNHRAIEIVHIDDDQQTIPAEQHTTQIGLFKSKTFNKGDGWVSWLSTTRKTNGYSTASMDIRRNLSSDSKEISGTIGIAISDTGITYGYASETPLTAPNNAIATKNFASGAGMPSAKVITMDIGASGATYTAPANGWFCLQAPDVTITSTKMAFVIRNRSRNIQACGECTTTNTAWLGGTVPVRTGDTIDIYFTFGSSAVSLSNFKLHFVYAQGNQ